MTSIRFGLGSMSNQTGIMNPPTLDNNNNNNKENF